MGILDGGKDVTIVGVAANARESLKEPFSPFIYISFNQFPAPEWRGMSFEVRTAGDPLALAADVQRAVHEAAPDVPVANVGTQAERIESSLAQERIFAAALHGVRGSRAYDCMYRAVRLHGLRGIAPDQRDRNQNCARSAKRQCHVDGHARGVDIDRARACRRLSVRANFRASSQILSVRSEIGRSIGDRMGRRAPGRFIASRRVCSGEASIASRSHKGSAA